MTVKAIHLICRRVASGSLMGVSAIKEEKGLVRSISWEFSAEVAAELVGGWVYFHRTKNEKSEAGGKIVRTEVTDLVTAHGKPEYALILRFQPLAKGQKWRGASHGMAWCGGLVDALLPHELAQ